MYTQCLPTISRPRFHAKRYFYFAYASLRDNALSLSAKSRKCFSALCTSIEHTYASLNACLRSGISRADFLYILATTSSNNAEVLAARYALSLRASTPKDVELSSSLFAVQNLARREANHARRIVV